MCSADLAGEQPAARVEHDHRAHVRGQLAHVVDSQRRREPVHRGAEIARSGQGRDPAIVGRRAGIGGSGEGGIRPAAEYGAVPLSRIAWLTTVCACLIIALILLISGYLGYAGVLLAIALSAAINLR